MGGQVSAPRSPDFPAVSCPIPKRRLLPKTLLCIYHSLSFPQQKGCCLPASHLSQAFAFPHASPPTLLCFCLLFRFFLCLMAYGSLILQKVNQRVLSSSGSSSNKLQMQSLSRSHWSPLLGEATHLPESFICLLWNSVF